MAPHPFDWKQMNKNFYTPAALAARCRDAGLDMDVREMATNFIYGVGTRR